MTYWTAFLDSLDSPGGHMIVALGLIGIGISIDSMELEMLGVGVLARGLGSTTRKDAA